DGRATAAQNCEERTGIAQGPAPDALTAIGASWVGEASDPGYGLRYLTVVDLGDGRERLYYELTNSSGSHDLVTELRPVAAAISPPATLATAAAAAAVTVAAEPAA